MTPPKLSSLAAEATRRAWRELGFFYARDEQAKEWRLTGSREGLLGFATLLAEYSADPVNDSLSEHEHFGPYMYLEVMTSAKPDITGHAIEGTVGDIGRLAEILEGVLRTADAGRLVIRDEYAPGADYSIVLVVKRWPFDPASLDPQL
jgi:hypothetical protein